MITQEASEKMAKATYEVGKNNVDNLTHLQARFWALAETMLGGDEGEGRE